MKIEPCTSYVPPKLSSCGPPSTSIARSALSFDGYLALLIDSQCVLSFFSLIVAFVAVVTYEKGEEMVSCDVQFVVYLVSKIM